MRTYAEILGIDLDYHSPLLTNDPTGITAWVVPDNDYDPIEPEVDQEYIDAGEVYGIVILDDEGEHLDSCWGFTECFSPNDPDSYIRKSAEMMLSSAVETYVQSGSWVAI